MIYKILLKSIVYIQLITLLFISQLFSQSQELSNSKFEYDSCLSGKEHNIWVLGSTGFDFSKGGDPEIVSGFGIKGSFFDNAYASLCDKNGNLLLYSDHDYIYNKYNEKLGNGQIFGIGGAVHNMVMVAMPGNDSLVYIISPEGGQNGRSEIRYLRSCIVNVKANAGRGQIVKIDKILKGSSCSVCATRHCNGKDWWIVGQETDEFGEDFYAWLVAF